MTEHEELLLRLDIERKEYVKEYIRIECRGNVIDLVGFSRAFEEYIQQRPLKKDGYRSISLKSFRDFLTLRITLKKVKFV
ncbi:hypothetical protein PAECIP111802_00615 [Paenibacillus allorhizosphaerae]|uniref:Core-binding (CB) domain-containing protein n=1 Tax=Paenibacillus allorhizosphaerae TaxID=2849866 RepID=A0ABN7TBP6_9BACL|nr:hypothetical protein PAECIP111802_00615 [Paenibacillus allorhizosphaerae]